MGVTAQSAQQMVVGAGDVLIDGVDAGATKNDNIWRLVRTYYSPDINGVAGRLKGTDFVQEETAEIETTLLELSSVNLSLAIPGGVDTPGDAAGTALGGGLTTTLAANSNIGDVNVKVNSVTTVNVGDVLMIGAAGSREFRTVTVVGTTGAGGTGVTFLGGLTLPHFTNDAVVSVVMSTLAADSDPGSLNVKVTAIPAGVVAGTWIRFGYYKEQEVRQVTSVGSTGAGGTGLGFSVPTVWQHRSGEFILPQTNDGSSSFGSNSGVTRRLPPSAYHNIVLQVPGLSGRVIKFIVNNAIAIDNPQYDLADSKELQPRLKFQARWDPAAATTSPWFINRQVP